jgi:hypothetical protein
MRGRWKITDSAHAPFRRNRGKPTFRPARRPALKLCSALPSASKPAW